MQNVIAELRSEQQKLLNELTKLVKPTAERSNQPVKPKTQPKPKPKPKKKERKEKNSGPTRSLYCQTEDTTHSEN